MPNGVSDREWSLLISKIDGLALDVQGLRADIAVIKLSGEGQRLTIKALPCDAHGARLQELARSQSELIDKIKYRLGWKALVVAIIPALAAGLMAGAKYL